MSMNTPVQNADDVAELVFAMVLHSTRNSFDDDSGATTDAPSHDERVIAVQDKFIEPCFPHDNIVGSHLCDECMKLILPIVCHIALSILCLRYLPYQGKTLIRPSHPACATPKSKVLAHTQVRDPRGSAAAC